MSVLAEDGVRWNGADIKKCGDYLTLSLVYDPHSYLMNGDASFEGTDCRTRAVLAMLEADKRPVKYERSRASIQILPLIIERLPMAELFNIGQVDLSFSNPVGLPDGALLTWPVGKSHGGNVIRVELRQPTDGNREALYRENGMQRKNGLWCNMHEPCFCRFASDCAEYIVGLLAGWEDKARRTHWLLFSATRYDDGRGGSQMGDFSRLLHVVRQKDGTLVVDDSLMDDLMGFPRP